MNVDAVKLELSVSGSKKTHTTPITAQVRARPCPRTDAMVPLTVCIVACAGPQSGDAGRVHVVPRRRRWPVQPGRRCARNALWCWQSPFATSALWPAETYRCAFCSDGSEPVPTVDRRHWRAHLLPGEPPFAHLLRVRFESSSSRLRSQWQPDGGLPSSFAEIGPIIAGACVLCCATFVHH